MKSDRKHNAAGYNKY